MRVCVYPALLNNYWDKHARLDTLSSPGRRGGGTSKGHSAASTQSQAEQVETSLTPGSFEPHLNRGYKGGKGMVGRLASGGVVWQGHRHVVSNVHRRGAVDRRGARGSSRCLTLLWWLTRRAGRHVPPRGDDSVALASLWRCSGFLWRRSGLTPKFGTSPRRASGVSCIALV